MPRVQLPVIAVLSAVGGLLVGFLAALVDRFFGLAGLVLWMVGSFALGVAGSRWAQKASAS